jgi:hypothetical protein
VDVDEHTFVLEPRDPVDDRLEHETKNTGGNAQNLEREGRDLINLDNSFGLNGGPIRQRPVHFHVGWERPRSDLTEPDLRRRPSDPGGVTYVSKLDGHVPDPANIDDRRDGLGIPTAMQDLGYRRWHI